MNRSDEPEVCMWKRLWELREPGSTQIEGRMREEEGASFVAHLRTGGYDGCGLSGSSAVVQGDRSAGTDVHIDFVAYLSLQP